MRTSALHAIDLRTVASSLVLLTVLALVAGCARLPAIPTTTLKPASLGTLHGHLLDHRPDAEQFRLRGPFEVSEREGVEILLSATERVVGNLYLGSPRERAPLVILLHGHENSRNNHAYQAHHLATWGLHSLAVDLPNEGPWLDNGRLLGRLVAHIVREPQRLDPRIDPARVLVAGHSFGAAAVGVALGAGAPAAGGVMLDPASTFNELPGYLSRIRKPVAIITADARVGLTERRDDFFHFIPAEVLEVSVADAHHEDAEFPLDTGFRLFEDAQIPREPRLTFLSTLTAAALSIALTGRLDYVWESMADPGAAARLVERMRK